MSSLANIFERNWSFFEKARFFFLALLVVSLPFCFTTAYQVFGIALIVFSIPLLLKKETFTPEVLLMGLLFFLSVVWSLLHMQWSKAASMLDRYYMIFFLPLVVCFTPFGKRHFYLVMKLFIGATLVAYIITLIGATYQYMNNIVPYTGRLSDVFFHEQLGYLVFNAHPTYFAFFGCISTLLLIFFFEDRKWTGAIAIGFMTIVIGMLMARVTIIIQPALILLFVFRNVAVSTTSRFIVTPIIVVVMAAGYFATTKVYDYPHRQISQDLGAAWKRSAEAGVNVTDWGVVHRFALWRAAGDVIASHPLAGVGPGNEKEVVNAQLLANGQEFMASLDYDPHNQLLAFLISYGFIGTILLLAAQVYLFVKSWGNWPYILFIIMIAMVAMIEALLLRFYGVAILSVFGSMLFFRERIFNRP